MSEQEARWGRLRELLSGVPGKGLWQDLLGHLRCWPPEQGRDVALAYAGEHLEGWEDRLRCVGLRTLVEEDAQESWVAGALVRCVDLSELPKKFGGIASLWQRPQMREVRCLVGKRCRLPQPLCEVLFGWEGVLESIVLERIVGGAQDALAAIAVSFGAVSLRELRLRSCRLGEQGARALASSATIRALECLELSDNQVREQAALALFSSPVVIGLRELRLARNGLKDRDVAALVRSPYLGALEVLDLAGNKLRDASLRLLASAPCIRALRVLDLSDNTFGLAGVQALLSSPYLGALEQLHLAGNRLSTSEATLLRESEWGHCLDL